MNDEKQAELRQKFKDDMSNAGYTPMQDRWSHIYNWKYKITGYTVEDGNAFRFWKMSGMTPVPW